MGSGERSLSEPTSLYSWRQLNFYKLAWPVNNAGTEHLIARMLPSYNVLQG